MPRCKVILLLMVSFPLFIPTLPGQVSSGDQGWQLNYRDTTTILKDITKASKLLEQGDIHRIEALKMFSALKDESNALSFHRGVIQSLMGMGACYYNNSEYEKAIEKAEEALKYAEQTGNNDYYGQIEGNMGITYAANKDNIEAIYHFRKALRYYENQDTLFRTGAGNLHVSIASLLLDMRRDSSALFYLDKAEAIAEEEKDDQLRCMVYMHKGRAVYALKPEPENWPEAEAWFLRALEIALRNNLKSTEIYIIDILARYALRAKEERKALLYLQQALSHPAMKESGKISYYINTGWAYYGLRQFDSAVIAFRQAEKMAQRFSGSSLGFEMKANINKGLAYALYYTYAYKEAAEYYHLALGFKDSIIKKDRDKRIYSLEEKYEVAKRDRELAENQLLVTQQQAALFRRNTLIIALLAGMAFSISGVFYYFRNKYRMQKKAQEQALEISTWKATMEGEEKERSRIAGTLHDHIGGSLSNLKMWLGSIREKHETLYNEKEYDEALSLLDNTLMEVRDTAHHLMPELLLQAGFTEAVHIYCEDVQKASGLIINFQYFGYIGNLDKNLELALYRIIQELLQNVIKHAKATNVLVQLSRHDTILSITVEDDGIGMNPGQQNDRPGLGLAAVKRSIFNLGGTINLQSEPGNGTTVDIDLDVLSYEPDPGSVTL